MDRMFVAGAGFPRSFTRVQAKGYKTLEIASDVTYTSYVDLFTEGDSLVLRTVDRKEADGSDEAYMLLCREFGLAGYRGKDRFRSQVSVLFLDNGWMLVTLWKGAVVVSLDGKLVIPNTGVATYPDVPGEDIYWLNGDKLMDYASYIKNVGSFLYDLELSLVLGGDNAEGMESFSFSHQADEDIDLSRGYIARYLQEHELKQEANAANSVLDLLAGGSDYDYGDDEDDAELCESDEFTDEDGEFDDSVGELDEGWDE